MIVPRLRRQRRQRPIDEPLLVAYVYGWREWWVRRGPDGPGWGVRPSHHRVRFPDGRVIRYVPFTEREGMEPGWHVLGLCVRRLRSHKLLPVGRDDLELLVEEAVRRWSEPGWYGRGGDGQDGSGLDVPDGPGPRPR